MGLWVNKKKPLFSIIGNGNQKNALLCFVLFSSSPFLPPPFPCLDVFCGFFFHFLHLKHLWLTTAGDRALTVGWMLSSITKRFATKCLTSISHSETHNSNELWIWSGRKLSKVKISIDFSSSLFSVKYFAKPLGLLKPLLSLTWLLIIDVAPSQHFYMGFFPSHNFLCLIKVSS